MNQNNLVPLWDSFEAMYFAFASLVMGLVLGILFPSLWRTFRRKFRDPLRYGILDSAMVTSLENPLTEISLDTEDTQTENNSEGEVTPSIAENTVSSWLVIARSKVQERKYREAIIIYLKLLSYIHVSGKETNRVLFELSQVYAKLGLYEKALDVCMELLHRKPKLNDSVEYMLDICLKNHLEDKVNVIANTYKGKPSTKIRLQFSHLFCVLGEQMLAENSLEKAKELAGQAAKWDFLSARTRALLWRVASKQCWNSVHFEKNCLNLLAADIESRIEIAKDIVISPYVGADLLADLFLKISELPDVINSFKFRHDEFAGFWGLRKGLIKEKNKLIHLIFYATSKLQSKASPSNFRTMLDVIYLFFPELLEFEPCFYLNNPEVNKSNLTIITYQALFIHECLECKILLPEFSWECPRCGALESLYPVAEMLTHE